MPKLRFLNENELLKALRNNDPDALAQVYKGYFPQILNLVLNNQGDEDEAKDVFQEAVIVLYENLQSDSFQLNCKIQTYLYAISKRLWLKQISRRNLYPRLAEDELESELSRNNLEIHWDEKKDEALNLLETSLADLGEPCRELIESFYVKKLSMTEISEKFGYTNSDNAKNQKYKCLLRLKKIYFDYYNKLKERV